MFLRITVLLLALALFASTDLNAETIHVTDPTAEALRDALATVAEKRKTGDRSSQTIVLAAGKFRLDKPIDLSAEIVGDGLVIRGSSADKTILTGAVELEKSRRVQEHWRYLLPSSVASLKRPNSQQRPRVILVDGKLRSAARHPNVGYNRIMAADIDRRSGFQFIASDVPPTLDLSFSPCDLVFLHDWSSSRLPIAKIDLGQSQLTTVGPIGCAAKHYAIDHFEKQPRYYLEGHPALADLAGEWFIDVQNNELVLVAGKEDIPPIVELPRLERLLVAGKVGQPITGLRLEGITFSGTRFPMPAGGLAGAQATMHEPRDRDGQRLTTNRPMLSAAVHLDQGVDCVLINCRFQSIGNTALWLGSRSVNSSVQACTFDSIGGNAINVGEDNNRRVDGKTWYQSAPDQVPTGNQIIGCKISHCGVMLSGSVAIWAAINRRLEISENVIADCPYTGISLGWIWNNSKSPAGENRIHHNQITRVMQVLSDGGGIYTLGRQPDSELSFNTITNVPLNAGRAESNGMFLDEGSTGFTVKENEFRRIAKSPVRFHKAGQNIVHANRWELETKQTAAVRYNNTPEKNITVSDNVILPRQKRIYLIGNSLTWDTLPPMLSDYVDWHVDCGKSLQFIFDHPADPCVASSRLWPIALRQLQYDFLSVQPHYGTNLDQDVHVISQWMDMQPHAIVVIHTGWARSATAAQEYVAADSDEMGHRPDYYSDLIGRLRERYPARQIRQTFATESLHQIAVDIEQGNAPIDKLTDLYRDAIHMTQAEGRYLMHNLMRVAVEQPPKDNGFAIGKENPKLKAYLDALIQAKLNQ